MRNIALVYVYRGIAAAGFSYFQVAMFVIAGQRQGRRIRQAFVRSLLRQVRWLGERVERDRHGETQQGG